VGLRARPAASRAAQSGAAVARAGLCAGGLRPWARLARRSGLCREAALPRLGLAKLGWRWQPVLGSLQQRSWATEALGRRPSRRPVSSGEPRTPARQLFLRLQLGWVLQRLAAAGLPIAKAVAARQRSSLPDPSAHGCCGGFPSSVVPLRPRLRAAARRRAQLGAELLGLRIENKKAQAFTSSCADRPEAKSPLGAAQTGCL
jgi:hypothetical protein